MYHIKKRFPLFSTISLTNIVVLMIICIAALSIWLGLLIVNRSKQGVKSFNPLANAALDENKHKWSDLIDKIGAEKAYEMFKKENMQLDFNKQHANAHVFGELLYDKLGNAGVTVCDNSFAFGCYHSFFAKAINTQGLPIIKTLDNECLKRYQIKSLGCAHGIGHGILYYLGKDKLLQALDACATLSWKGPLGGCSSGVFMEYNLNTMNNPGGDSQWIRKVVNNDLHYPCDVLPQKYDQACYLELPQWWYIHFGGGIITAKQIGMLCNQVTDTLQKNACYRGAGNFLSPSTRYNVAETIRYCQQMPDIDGKNTCLIGASWAYEADPIFKKDAPLICQNTDTRTKNQCAQKIIINPVDHTS